MDTYDILLRAIFWSGGIWFAGCAINALYLIAVNGFDKTLQAYYDYWNKP